MLQLIKLLTANRNRQLMPFQQYIYKLTDNGVTLEIETNKSLMIPVNEHNLLPCNVPSVTLGTGIDISQIGVDVGIRLEPPQVFFFNECGTESENVYERRIIELEDMVQELRDQIEMLTRNGDKNET